MNRKKFPNTLFIPKIAFDWKGLSMFFVIFFLLTIYTLEDSDFLFL